MVFQWFYHTIECFFADQPLKSMFFDGFHKFRCDGQRWFWPGKNPKNRDRSNFAYYLGSRSHCNLLILGVNQTWKTVFCRFKVGGWVFWTFSTLFCYHRKLSMVFKVTITIEWNGWVQPLGSMVFWSFWGNTTIGNNGFWWLCTISPTMEWLCTIVEVYARVWFGWNV